MAGAMVAVVLAGALAVAVPAAAGQAAPEAAASRVASAAGSGEVDQRPQAAPPKRPMRIGFRAFALFDYEAMTASQSFDAVLGASRFGGVGAGGDVFGFWKGAFARVSFARMKETGSRVDVFNDNVTPLGIAVTVEMTPLEIGGGWRLRLARAPRFTPYAGYAALFLNYKETSDFAGPDENTSEVFNGHTVFGGVDITVWKWVSAGVEVAYRTVGNALGEAGVSEIYNETNLGGTTVRVMVGIRR
jgi:hypothetical protein